MNYRSYYDMSLAIWQYLPRLSVNYDLIVGVPQSGMIPATMLASYLKVRLSSLDLFVKGNCMTSGMTRTDKRKVRGLSGIHNVLVIDDSIYYGNAIREAKRRIKASPFIKADSFRIDYAAVYSRTGNDEDILFSFAVCPTPRVFQWNIFNHPKVTQNSCYDIDGVLCRDPTPEQNDDGSEYEKFLRTASKCVNVKFPIGALISARLEKYRELTVEWLHNNGFQWKELVLLDLPSREARIKAGAHASFKANVYRNRPETLFVESDWEQAVEIAHLSGKDVFCTQTMSYIDGNPKFRKLENSVAPLQKAMLDIENEKQRYRDIERRVDVMREEIRQLKGRIDMLRESKNGLAAKADELRAANRKMAQKMSELRESKSGLAAKADELRAANREMAQKISELRESKSGLAAKVDELRAANREMAQKMSELRESKSGLAAKVDELRESKHEMAEKIDSLRIAKSTISNKAEMYRKRLSGMNSDAMILKTENKRLKVSLQKSEGEIEKYRAEREMLKSICENGGTFV